MAVYLTAVALFGYVIIAADSPSPTARYRARGWPGALTAAVAFAVMTTVVLGWVS